MRSQLSFALAIVIGGVFVAPTIAQEALEPLPEAVDVFEQDADQKGFRPQYLGVGSAVYFDGDAQVTQGRLFGAYGLKGAAPVTFRGYISPGDDTVVSGGLSYDWGVANNTNVYVGANLTTSANADRVFPGLSVGAEYLTLNDRLVINAEYERVLEGFNVLKAGLAYQF